MSDTGSPTLRLIPYLLAITVTVFVGLSVFGTTGDVLLRLLIAVICYFGTYYLSKFVIHFFLRRSRDDDQ